MAVSTKRKMIIHLSLFPAAVGLVGVFAPYLINYRLVLLKL